MKSGARPLWITSWLIASCVSASLFPLAARAEGGSIHNHLTLDVLPIAFSANNPGGGALALSYDRYHDWLKSSYSISLEASIPYSLSEQRRLDVISELGFFTEITRAFSVGARVGLVTNNPGTPAGFGALGLRLPALYPEQKEFLSFFFEEIDLGMSGAGERYGGLRLGMKLL
jgi:hypothetical protein